jgi:DNA invertase Pin-like site-specific DNA recombinase
MLLIVVAEDKIMIIGYARTSTRDQQAGFEAQIAELTRTGCERLYQEQVSAVKEREQLSEAIDFARQGDVLVVTKLDRLARSVPHLYQIVEELEKKGVTLRILNIGLDSSTPTGKLMLTMLGAIAQFEREMMLERQRDGIAAAKEQGKYKGRQPTARAKSVEVLKLIAEGKTRQEIADKVEIGVASVYRILAQQRAMV